MSSPPPVTYDVSELVAYDFFGYEPSMALAGIACGLFLLASLIVGLQTYLARNPNAKYMHLVTTTGLTEAGGYASLIWLINNSGSANIYASYVIMQVLTILAPNLLQAANYTTASKVITITGLYKETKFWSPRVVTWGFIGADVGALVVQSIGISIWASSKGSGEPDQDIISLGSWITVAGLVIQLVSYVFFIFVAVWTHRHPKNALRTTPAHRRTFWGLYTTIVLVTIRNVFRFVEFVQGAILTWPYSEETYVISEKQVLFYALDTLPVLLCFVFYVWFNPAVLLPKAVEEAKAGGIDVENQGESEVNDGSTSEEIKSSDFSKK